MLPVFLPVMVHNHQQRTGKATGKMSNLSQVLDKIRAEIAKLKGKNLNEANTKDC